MVHYFAISLDQGLCVEGCFSIQHLVHDNTQRPPVALYPIAAFTVLLCLREGGGSP